MRLVKSWAVFVWMPQCYCSPSVQEYDGEIVLTVDEKDSKDQVEAGK
jgi:hypothetical protein